jgi:uncharacterized protein (TIGR02145 family)
VKGGKDMTGELDFHVPDQIVKDLPASFRINSTLAAGELPITYEWFAPDFSATTFGGNTFTGVPGTAGSHTITLQAKANGYTTVSTPKIVDVMDGLDMGTLTIVADGGNPSSSFVAGINTIIFKPELTGSPISPVTYTWEASSCKPDVFTGDQFQPILPSNAGNYTLKLTASATGYHSKTATFDYTITCTQMPVSFNLTRTELLTGDETTLSVNPSVSGASYTWRIPTDFAITAGSSITPSVTIQAPPTALVDPVPLTLAAEAVNYCPATYTSTITVKECSPFPNLPEITANLGESNGFVTVPSRRNVTFSTPIVEPLRASGTATYEWKFMPSSSSPFTPSASNNGNEFTTAAPEFNAETYTLNLTVTADGYCPHTPVAQKVLVAEHTDQLRGTIIVKEAMKSTNPSYANQDSTVWIAKDYATTLTAVYIPAAGENDLKLTFTWKWLETNDSESHNLSPNSYHDTIGFTPVTTVDDGWLTVEVTDYNGKGPALRAYRYTVNDCHYTGTDLYVNINSQCGVTDGAGNYTAFIKDAKDDKKYKIAQIQNRWWFTENLKRNVGSHQETPSGYFYSSSESHSTNICPAGWRIPTGTDWINLAGITSSNQDQFKQLIINRTTDAPYDGTAWAKYINTPGDDRHGFSAIPAGYYYGSTLLSQGEYAYFLTDGTMVYYFGDNSNLTIPVTSKNGVLDQRTIPGDTYYNVRCVRDY